MSPTDRETGTQPPGGSGRADGGDGGDGGVGRRPGPPPCVVVLGASWGGLHALSLIVRGLPADLPAAVVVVQHRGKDSGGLLAELLQDVTALRVLEVENKEPVCSGHAYIAPPDYHLLVDPDVFSLSVDPVVRYSRPSIDVTMTSAADSFGARAIAVVLTGANDDGARGARYVVDRGGHALVQAPETAEVRTMPDGALRTLAGAPIRQWEVAPLDAIAARIVALATTAARAADAAPDAAAAAPARPAPAPARRRA